MSIRFQTLILQQTRLEDGTIFYFFYKKGKNPVIQSQMGEAIFDLQSITIALNQTDKGVKQHFNYSISIYE